MRPGLAGNSSRHRSHVLPQEPRPDPRMHPERGAFAAQSNAVGRSWLAAGLDAPLRARQLSQVMFALAPLH